MYYHIRRWCVWPSDRRTSPSGLWLDGLALAYFLGAEISGRSARVPGESDPNPRVTEWGHPPGEAEIRGGGEGAPGHRVCHCTGRIIIISWYNNVGFSRHRRDTPVTQISPSTEQRQVYTMYSDDVMSIRMYTALCCVITADYIIILQSISEPYISISCAGDEEKIKYLPRACNYIKKKEDCRFVQPLKIPAHSFCVNRSKVECYWDIFSPVWMFLGYVLSRSNVMYLYRI